MLRASSWIVGGLTALLGLVGLLMSSRAADDVIYATGLVVFVFAVLFCFALIAGFGKGGRT